MGIDAEFRVLQYFGPIVHRNSHSFAECKRKYMHTPTKICSELHTMKKLVRSSAIWKCCLAGRSPPLTLVPETGMSIAECIRRATVPLRAPDPLAAEHDGTWEEPLVAGDRTTLSVPRSFMNGKVPAALMVTHAITWSPTRVCAVRGRHRNVGGKIFA